jgi:hypothetical protein
MRAHIAISTILYVAIFVYNPQLLCIRHTIVYDLQLQHTYHLTFNIDQKESG